MKRILLGVLALVLALSLPAVAGGRAEVRKTIEASMLLTGTLLVGPEGRVSEYAIDQPEKVESGVLEVVKGNIRQWRFEPALLAGVPVSQRNKMSIRIVANKLENGDFAVRLGGVSFTPFKVEEGTQVLSVSLTPPRYPVGAARADVGGTVYLVVKVGRDGSVQNVVVEQVNLQFLAGESTMNVARQVFADASIKASKQWRFAPPVKGEDVDSEYWSVRVPVAFVLENSKSGYGKWEAYVPGPRHQIPWGTMPDLPNFSPDTMVADGSVYQAGKGLRLLTPLQGG